MSQPVFHPTRIIPPFSEFRLRGYAVIRNHYVFPAVIRPRRFVCVSSHTARRAILLLEALLSFLPVCDLQSCKPSDHLHMPRFQKASSSRTPPPLFINSPPLHPLTGWLACMPNMTAPYKCRRRTLQFIPVHHVSRTVGLHRSKGIFQARLFYEWQHLEYVRSACCGAPVRNDGCI